ncbi:LysM peptidoglycan-binding domain-containing protein [Winogradskyella sp.]|uniref:LysM peptidoglycan-binding domain-containing protein n=1 Tax=Winogradskyella sp. TaxID=1883156 RepID=UPI003F6A9399
MQRNFKLVLSIVVVLLSGLLAFAQDDEFKDVILDGKPAKLNVATGEITLVNEDKNKTLKIQVDRSKPKDSLEISTDYYVVKDGESLFDIAKRFKVSMADLKNANNLETTLIDEGQKLKVRHLDVPVNKEANKVIKKKYSSNNSDYHIVSEGETLYSIAKRYNGDLTDLKHQNHIKSNLIKVGDKLRIRNFKSAANTYGDSYWLVSKGDTLYSIAKKSGITVDTIKHLNALSNNIIYIGQKLKLK